MAPQGERKGRYVELKWRKTKGAKGGTMRMRTRAASGLAILVGALLAISSSPALALCVRWDVSGKWNIEQESPTAHVEVDLTQNGTEITGTARYNGQPGTVKGTLVGQDFSVEISSPTWKHVFRGVVGPERIAGVMRIEGASDPIIWYSTTAMKCVEEGATPSSTP